jgi:hypothetical protein
MSHIKFFNLLSVILIVLSITTVSQVSMALGQKLPEDQVKNEKISEQKVMKDFWLTSVDGKQILFKTVPSFESSYNQSVQSILAQLPKPKSANKKECGSNKFSDLQFDLLMMSTDLAIKYIQGETSVMDAKAKKLLEKTPHCEPFIEKLMLIAKYYGIDTSALDAHTNLLKEGTKFSLVKNNKKYALELSGYEEGTFHFQIKNKVSAISKFSDLEKVRIAPADSGQGVGVQFQFLGESNETSKDDSFEMDCTEKEQVYPNSHHKYDSECYLVPGQSKKVCSEPISEPTEYITHHGKKMVTPSTDTKVTTMKVIFYDAQQSLMEGIIHHVDSKTTYSDSSCRY